MQNKFKTLLITVITLFSINVIAQKNTSAELKPALFDAFKFRNVGPALTSGRIADIAVNPNNFSQYYVAVASGGVWKTDNAGTTFKPIFDSQGAYSIACVTIDPNNENAIWVGTGENNNQRSVAYGDGVYFSADGGKSWKNMGLKTSEHIGNIIVHPKNSKIVYVAAYGPLWKEGGERGVYKTTDGGKTWERVLFISDDTGISEIVMDPRNPDVLYAAAHQRRRHVFTYVGGGPESGIHKTTDGGKTWEKVNKGLPKEDIGRIGLAISPANPEFIYAIVEAANDKNGGFYRSNNRGASWEKRGDYSTSGNYYQEIICDPKNPEKVYAMDTWLHHTEDGGKTFKKTGEKHKHVDNHCIWINPNNTNHFLIGTDGGIYETWDGGTTYQYKTNLPVTQFYKVTVDNTLPFYYIYGGTQDNNSIGGPSNTTNHAGIVNSDWFITNGGDGFESQVDPVDPNIVYSQAQYGWLVRYEKNSGEKVPIQPFPKQGQPAYRWNWDAPLLISPHEHKRLYFAANKLFKSNDRGNSWEEVSGDLTRQLDRNKMKVMGKVWSMDAVMKNKSTTIYGNIVALDESPLKEGLLYVGTDDGLIQVSENGGNSWEKYEKFADVPEMTYVNMLKASKHNQKTVYAVFNNHKRGDFTPYLLKSEDAGKSWKSIAGNLPKNGAVYSFAEDHKNPDLLFAGTEFGVFVTLNGGEKWFQLKSGVPTIAIRDMEIQERENDLVLGSFGRGFFVLDNYAPLRELADKELLKKKAHLFDIKKGLMYIPSQPLGGRDKASQGESYFTAENKPLGAVITYYFSDTLKTAKEKRKALEKKNTDDYYPSLDEIRKEATEEKPYFLFVIKDATGNEVQKITSEAKAGINKVVWNYRYSTTTPIKLKEIKPGRYGSFDVGQLALPGTYSVTMYLDDNGKVTQLAEPKSFEIDLLNNNSLAAADKKELLAFQKEVAELRRSVQGTGKLMGEIKDRLAHIKKAIQTFPSVDVSLLEEVQKIQVELEEVSIMLHGDNAIAKYEFETYPSIMDRIETVVYGLWNSTSAPTTTSKDNIAIAKNEYKPVLTMVQQSVKKVEALEKKLAIAPSPYTPGRNSEWKEE